MSDPTTSSRPKRAVAYLRVALVEEQIEDHYRLVQLTAEGLREAWDRSKGSSNGQSLGPRTATRPTSQPALSFESR